MSGCAESFSKVPHGLSIHHKSSSEHLLTLKDQCIAIDNFDVTHVPKTIDLRAPSSFFEQPTDNTTDEAWLELLAPANIRVTAAELARNNRNSVELPGGGYLAWLGVYHEIHCLNLLRKWKYRSHYFPDITPEREDLLQFHTDHCLDRIRATLMCSPDTSSLVTFDWRKAQKPVVNATKTLHSCVDWKHVIESTRSRSVSSAEMKSLVNPNLVGRGIKK
ncbi:hypothetical protein HYFRA_00001035 [Hymenoscyphus fraxineus]|uniref:Uncharacterized protein n=1 Tax=Hymenoscyphus fraxineus TaxID=746836 RepID=A0A9N9KSG8_9HELO|nr:hypothetical protein HYFRA_00001035 [Hymenoscyphus fraxineus]